MERRTFTRLLAGTTVGASMLGSVTADDESEPACDPRTPYCGEFEYTLGTEIKTTTALNVRSGPGLDDDVQYTVSEGAEGRVISRPITGDYAWYRVKWDRHGKPGWSASEFVEPQESQPRDAFDYKDFTTAGTAVTIQKQPYPRSKIEGAVPPETILTIFQGPIDSALGGNYRWWKVSGDGLSGWARESEIVSDTNTHPPAFEIGDHVRPTTGLSVRAEPRLDAPRLTVVRPDDIGEVVPDDETAIFPRAYHPADGYLWWKVDWESGPTGWSVQTYLDED